MIYKGSPQLELDELEFWKCFLISFGFSFIFGLGSFLVYLPIVEKRISVNNSEIEDINRTESYTESFNNNFQEFSFNYNQEDDIDESIKKSKMVTEKLEHKKTEKKNRNIT